MTRTAFVTGATGFLGRHVTESLLRSGWEVTALCLPEEDVTDLRRQVRVTRGNVLDLESIRHGMPPQVDAVLHLAGDTSTWARQARRQYEINVVGSANVVEAACLESAGRLVVTSSVSAYGYQPGRRLDENTASNALSRGDNYGRTKYLAERGIRRIASERGLDAVILNPVNILGPYDRNNWSRQLITPVARGELAVIPPGRATWAYAPDVAEAHLAAIDRGRSGHNYILGGVEASFLDVVNEVESVLGKRLSRRATPGAVLRLAVAAAWAQSKVTGREPAITRPRYRRAVGDLRCDDGKAQRELGYPHTDLSSMLVDTMTWLGVA